MGRPRLTYPKPRSLPRGSVPSSVVKSAARALQLLEFFDDIKRPACLTEIAETLDYPQSSVSALLRTLVLQGYLTYDAQSRQYAPSIRVTLLGHWIGANVVADGALLQMMAEINRRTGHAVTLVTRRGLFAQYIYVIQAINRARLHLTLGALLPLVASSSGYTLLSCYPDSEVKKIVRRSNAEAEADAPRVQVADILKILQEIRESGYCFKTGVTTLGGGTIIIPLPVEPGLLPLAVGVGGIAEEIRRRRNELVAVLREEIVRYLASSPSLLALTNAACPGSEN